MYVLFHPLFALLPSASNGCRHGVFFTLTQYDSRDQDCTSICFTALCIYRSNSKYQTIRRNRSEKLPRKLSYSHLDHSKASPTPLLPSLPPSVHPCPPSHFPPFLPPLSLRSKSLFLSTGLNFPISIIISISPYTCPPSVLSSTHHTSCHSPSSPFSLRDQHSLSD
jgi:hypothetical protein